MTDGIHRHRAPRRANFANDDWWYEQGQCKGYEVYEDARPTPTGLLNASGQMIFRVRGKLGFDLSRPRNDGGAK